MYTVDGLLSRGGIGWFGGKEPEGIKTTVVGPIDRCRTSSQHACAQTIKPSPTSKRDADITAVDMAVECIYQVFLSQALTLFLLRQRLFGNARRTVARLRR